ncbi:unnamed protein product [Dracunculus medinensis]|uniref:Domain of unknown function DB domain-containing protein n=1 Tax=Dracunculus medinensis TaxID=318479 RepID=A0A3P7PEH4_DRAME|nr:unnamed protein product [Dracunculus medinensis]
MKCCKERNVDVKCESRCNFDILSRRVLMAMFIGSDPCPQNHGRDLMLCAAQKLDHTACCKLKGVSRTAAGEKCLGFCRMTVDNRFQIDLSMLPCWAVLNDIKDCFKEEIILKVS